MNLQFEHTQFIYLFIGIGIVIVAYFIYLVWRKKVEKRLGDAALVKRHITPYSTFRSHAKFTLLIIGLSMGILCAMNLRTPSQNTLQQKKGIDIVFALDVSKSMLAQDVLPSRMDKAKQFITNLMKAATDNRYALVIFAGGAYLQMPLTSDANAAQFYINSTYAGAIPQQGTNISMAISRGATAFSKNDFTYKTLILITDGEDHDNNAISTANSVATKGVIIYTVGIGSSAGVFIPDESGHNKKDIAGNDIISKLNEPLLKEIATVTKGAYIHLDNTANATSLLNKELSKIPSKPIQDTSYMNFDSYYMYFAIGMLLLLLIEMFIPVTKKEVA